MSTDYRTGGKVANMPEKNNRGGMLEISISKPGGHGFESRKAEFVSLSETESKIEDEDLN